MIIGNFNATAEQLWKWFTVPGTDARVHLKLISRDELTQMAKSPDLSQQARYIVVNCFDNFENMKDASGVEIPNSEDNRAVMLTFRPLWAFVTSKLTELGEWVDEGKGGSGSAS